MQGGEKAMHVSEGNITNCIQPLFENIPSELKDWKQWVLWKLEIGNRNGSTMSAKVPYDPKTLLRASVKSRKTWSDFKTAIDAFENGEFNGIGFVLSPDDPFFAVDFDNCIDETKVNSEIVKHGLSLLATYTEISPSGNGLHQFGKLKKLPKDSMRNKHPDKKVEIYWSGRFMTVTGSLFKNYSKEIEFSDESFYNFHEYVFGLSPNNERVEAFRIKKRELSKNDWNLIKKVQSTDNEDKFSQLWLGNWEEVGYKSQSEADFALCLQLANIFDRNPSRIDAAFRKSGLAREKWDSKRGNTTYGEMTISKVITKTQSYKPNDTSTESSMNAIENTKKIPSIKNSQPNEISKSPGFKAWSLSDLDGVFSQKIDWIWREHIPARLPIIVNGREGMGKTTICLQIAKEIIASHHEGVVYWFSTEGTVSDTFIKAKQLSLPNSDRFIMVSKKDNDFIFNFRSIEDRRTLDELLSKSPQPALAVFIDSIRGMTSQDPNSEEIGHTIRHLNSIACDKNKTTLVYLHHLNKNRNVSMLDRNTGSTSITAAARLVLTIIENSKYSRKIVTSKSNIGEVSELIAVKQDESILIHCSEDNIDLSESGRAEKFLLNLFKNTDKLLSNEVLSKGKAGGFSESILKKVKSRLGIKANKNGKDWYWVYRRN